MKKFSIFILTAVLLCSFTACAEPTAHSFSEVWSYDDTYHWHAAVDSDTDEVSDKGEHDFKDGKCSVCGFPDPGEPVFADSGTFSQQTTEATESERETAEQLIGALAENCETGGFVAGDFYSKEHLAEGTEAKNTEVTIDGFQGGLFVADTFRVGITEYVPSYGNTKKQYYYADGDCAIENLGTEKNYYQAGETVSYLVEDVFEELKTEIYNARDTFRVAKVSYGKDSFEVVKLEYPSGTQNNRYVFVFFGGALAGMRIERSYASGSVAVTKQYEMLIGDYPVEKPDTTGFNSYSYRPKWAAGYPTYEIFEREYEPASESDIKGIRNLFRKAVARLSSNNTNVLAEGDIRFTYESVATKNDLTIDKGEVGMRVHEKSEGILRTDEEITLEHYADVGVCYEILNDGKPMAYNGSYALQFYSKLPYMLVQMCDYISQFGMAYSEGVTDAYDVYVCRCEYQAVKLVVDGCGEMYYIFDADGMLLASRIEFKQQKTDADLSAESKNAEEETEKEVISTRATILVGKFDVTIPTYTDYDVSDKYLDLGYLGVSSSNFGVSADEFEDL